MRRWPRHPPRGSQTLAHHQNNLNQPAVSISAQMRWATVAQLASHTSAALIVVLGLLGDVHYYVRLQTILALNTFSGLLHLGLADALFQWKLQKKSITDASLTNIKVTVTALSAIGALLFTAHKSLEDGDRLAVYLMVLITNRTALKHALNNGAGNTQIQSRALLVEKMIWAIVIGLMIVSKTTVDPLWVPAAMLIGLLLIHETRQEAPQTYQGSLKAALSTGLPIMALNLTAAAHLPLITLIMSARLPAEEARPLLIITSLCGALLAYISNYSLIVTTNDRGPEIQRTLYTRLTFLVTLAAGATTLLALPQTPWQPAKPLATIGILVAILWLVEIRNLVLFVPLLRRRSSISTLVVANTAGLATLAIAYVGLNAMQAGATTTFGVLLLAPSAMRHIILSNGAGKP